MKRIPKLFRILFAVAFWIFVWWAAAKSVGSELLFPAPAAVFRVLWALVRSKEFYLVTGRSLLNVVTGILAAVAVCFWRDFATASASCGICFCR
jgi:ABC-type nitrate/sulfonate/bicarbonate transport system permease component